MISLAMATYNGEKFIIQQLDSIRNQSKTINEVIICDDASTDSTYKIISEYIKKYDLKTWKLISNDKNLGYTKNFFKAISLTRGDLVFLSDQDDIWLENKVEEICTLFYENPTMEYIHTNIEIIDAYGKIINKNYKYNKKDNYNVSFMKFCKRLNYCGMSCAFTSSIRKKLITLKDVEITAHDWLLPALAVISRGFCVSKKICTLRRYHENNVALKLKGEENTSKEQRILMAEKYIIYYNELLKIFKKNKHLNIRAEDIKTLERFENVAIKRKQVLEMSDFFGYVRLAREIKYLPSIFIYIKDGMCILGKS